MVSSIEN